MSKLAADHNAINLSQGFPDFPISEKLIELTVQSMKEGQNQYAPMPGLPQLRKVIAEKYAHTYGINIDYEKEITITAGATEALYSTIAALIKTGDEVIILEPAYDSYAPSVIVNGGIPVYVPLSLPDFHVDWEKVRSKISEKTCMIILNTPHNPTGAVLSSEDLDELEMIIEKHGLFILSDEVYEHLLFDGRVHQSMLKRPALRARSICVFSFGKTFHTTGWKVGYLIAADWITTEVRKVHQFITFSVNTPIQHAFAAFLSDEKNYNYLPGFFQQKRDLFLKVIEQSGFQPVGTSGTYFQLLSYREISQDNDFDMAVRMTKEYKIASIPVSVFYSTKQDDKILRFCFAKENDTLKQAGKILCRI
jgi:methionine transaminase